MVRTAAFVASCLAVMLLAATAFAQAGKPPKPPAKVGNPPKPPAKAEEPPAPPKDDSPDAIARDIGEGRRLLQAGAMSRADAMFRELVRRAPQNPVVHNELGVALFQQGASEASIEHFQRAVKLDDKFANAWANLGEALRLSKKHKNAALAFHRFLQLQKNDRHAIYGLALCFEGYEALDKALATLQVAEQAAKEDVRLLARVNAAVKRVKDKIAEARLPLLERADAHFVAGRFQQALALYEEGLTKKKDDPVLLGRRGLVKAVLGDLPGGRVDLEVSLLAAPNDGAARAAYALLLDAVGQPEPAVDIGAGTALLRADRAAMAHKSFSSRLMGAPEDQAAMVGRGEAALRMGWLESALQDFAAGGKGKEAAAGLAEAHWMAGSDANAKEILEAAGLNVPLSDLCVWRRSLLMEGEKTSP